MKSPFDMIADGIGALMSEAEKRCPRCGDAVPAGRYDALERVAEAAREMNAVWDSSRDDGYDGRKYSAVSLLRAALSALPAVSAGSDETQNKLCAQCGAAPGTMHDEGRLYCSWACIEASKPRPGARTDKATPRYECVPALAPSDDDDHETKWAKKILRVTGLRPRAGVTGGDVPMVEDVEQLAELLAKMGRAGR